MKRVALLFLFIALFSFTHAQETAIDKLFRSSYRVWELQRNDIGMYRDSKLFNGVDYHPCSVANVGIGLISLCIADSMAWDEEALQKALITLKSITGYTPGFNADRNASGFYRHFIDMKTGKQHWNSEYSTIDTEILVAGALFAKNYFQNDSISKYALELWNSIDHEKAIANAESGKIFLTMESNGEGTSSKITSVYNEYMIVAWMAKNSTANENSPAHKLWNNFYADPDNLPRSNYNGNSVLTDRNGAFLSSFTHLFNYYLCHYFTTSEKYIDYLKQARKAETDWWKNSTTAQNAEWGCGAGTGPDGYHADKINDNPNQVISPHIIAGYIPVFTDAENHLKEMWQSQKGRYVFPNYPGDVFLWRYSLKNPTWKATEVQGIDYSTMLFGLASLSQFLGSEFFERNNNYFDDTSTNLSTTKLAGKVIRLFGNPVHDSLAIELLGFDLDIVDIEVLNLSGKVLIKRQFAISSESASETISVSKLNSGVHFVCVSINGTPLETKKFIKN